MTPVYEVNQRVRFLSAKCNCVGGGFSHLEGNIVGILPPKPNGIWYQIDQPNGIVIVQEKHILAKLS